MKNTFILKTTILIVAATLVCFAAIFFATAYFANCKGDPGEQGVGISGATVTNGSLVLTLTDGTTLNAGSVKGDTGAAGKGVVSVEKTDSNKNLDVYTITYTDGSKSNFMLTNGENGADGKDGVSVTAVEINDDGELVISFSEGNPVNVGKVVGIDGNDGISVTSVEINDDGELVISFSEGNPVNLGRVVGIDGKNGISVTAVEINDDGELVISFSEGNPVNLGRVVGIDGKNGISVTAVEINDDGELIISFSEGEPVNLGKIVGDDAAHANETHTVTYDPDGGRLPNGAATSVTVNYGDVLDLPIPTRVNYTFEGWYTGNTVNDGKFTTVTPVTKTLTLVARWKADVQYRLSFETDGGNAIAPAYYDFDEQITELPTPSKYDCEFAGWYQDEALTTRVAYPLTLTQNTTVYAKWETAYYYINFHTNASPMSSVYAAAGTSYDAFNAPNKEGSSFVGWYLDSGFTQPVTYPFELHADTDLFAKWNYVYYGVSFMTNGGSYISSKSYQSGLYVSEFPAPTKDGYLFDGWYLDGTLNRRVTYPFKIADNYTLYAKWVEDPGYVRITDTVTFMSITDPDKNYILMNDIDFTGVTLSQIAGNFTGIFDGQGYTLTNLNVANGGLFFQNSGTIKNLKILNANIEGYHTANNGIIACTNDGTISNVSVAGKISFTDSDAVGSSTGMVVGENNGNVFNCYVSGSVDVTTYNSDNVSNIGSVVGYNKGTIKNVYSTVSVKSKGTFYQYTGRGACWIGGIAGNNSGTISSIIYVGSVTFTGNYHKGKIGAISGYTDTSLTVEEKCYKTCNVSGGTQVTTTYLDSKSFYTDTLGWSEEYWDLSNLDYEMGLVPKIK